MASWGSSSASAGRIREGAGSGGGRQPEEQEALGEHGAASRARRHTVGGPDGEPAAASGGERPRRTSEGQPGSGPAAREWVTTRATAWLTAPRAGCGKISDLPAGRVLVEVPCARAFEGWCPVAPRGFVARADLAPAAAAEAAPSPVAAAPVPDRATLAPAPAPEPPAAAVAPALQASVVPTPPTAAAAAAQEGVSAEEQRSAAQRELEALQQARDAMASELEALREQREAEHRRLQRCREKRGRMEEKLRVCSDAVARTVHSLDRVHELEEHQRGGAELQSAQSDALAAGLDAERALHSLSGGSDHREDCEGANGAVHEDPDASDGEGEKENDPPAGAFRKGLGDQWDGVKACGKRVLVALPEDVPVEDFDEEDDARAPLRQIQLK